MNVISRSEKKHLLNSTEPSAVEWTFQMLLLFYNDADLMETRSDLSDAISSDERDQLEQKYYGKKKKQYQYLQDAEITFIY